MKVPSQFKVGDITLKKGAVTPESLKALKSAALDTAVEGGGEAAAKIVDKWMKEGSIDDKEFKTLNSFAYASKKEFRAANSDLWDIRQGRVQGTEEDKKAAELRMGKEGAIVGPMQKLKDRLREATALAGVKAIAGSFPGPTMIVAGYSAYANGTKWDGKAKKATTNLIETYSDFLTGDSRMNTSGNKVQQAHRENLWAAVHSQLDNAIEAGENGKPTEVTMQYYELTSSEVVGKTAKAVETGNKVRVNVDIGRLSYPGKDADGKFFEVDDIQHKARTIMQLAGTKGDIGVSVFAVHQELGDPTNLMHRKVLRSDNTVLLSGMNANDGSGENVDAGYLITGPAAKVLTENVARDMTNSAGSGVEEIWGQEHYEGFKNERLMMGGRGLAAMLDNIGGPSKPGTDLAKPKNKKEWYALATKADVKLNELFKDGGKGLAAVVDGENAELSDAGKAIFVQNLDNALAATQTKKNVAAINDIGEVSGKVAGKTKVDIADLPSEREVLMINAVAKAEKFIYLPGFVLTRAVAAAIVAKKEQQEAQGKPPLDIKILADPGIYPDGGSPNSWGVKFLEDNGITARWAKLSRTGWHDRKIHAKQLITDKGEMSGSTNFSKKAMADNWETSTYVHFEKGDKEALANRDRAVEQFNDLWEHETFELNTLDLAGAWNKNRPDIGKEYVIEDSRNGAVKKILKGLEKYEEETAVFVQDQLKKPEVAAAYEANREAGMAEGYAKLKAVRNTIGDEAYHKALNDLPANKALERLKPRK